jgi:glycerol-3-phosphate dehydrogenase
MVINRLHAPGDGDIVVPQRQRTILGTSSWVTDDPGEPPVLPEHVETIMRESSALLPALAGAEIRARWTAVRPLVGSTAGKGSGRDLTREILCVDHAKDRKPMEGFVTIAGGKATTLRAIAEIAANTVCAKLGVEGRCTTGEVVLLPHTAWYVG